MGEKRYFSRRKQKRITMDINHDYCVIMAGGIGSRFWPYSRIAKPKQFIDFFGTGRTLLQQTYDRFCQIVPRDHIIISTHRDYSQLVQEQLPDLNPEQILHEPAYKRTAPSMALAAYHLRDMDPQANIVMAPADQLIVGEDRFFDDIRHALAYTAQQPNLVTVGIRPTYPETRYGYIQVDNKGPKRGFQEIRAFTEKPHPDFARVFFESGEFYWNTGLFIWRASAIIDAMHTLLPEMCAHFDAIFTGHPTRDARRAELYRRYESFPSLSVDYAVIEKAANMYMLAGTFGWTDVGRWEDVYHEMKKDADGNASRHDNVLFYNSHNDLVVAPEGKAVVVKDLDGYLVNVTDDMIIICPRDEDDIHQFRNDVMVRHGDEKV